MSAPRSPELADDIEATVRATPGVAGIFRAGSAAEKMIDAGARVLGFRDADASLVRLDQTAEGVCVDLAIGVHASAGTVETSSLVQTAIDALCVARSVALAELRLTVVHVDDSSSAV